MYYLYATFGAGSPVITQQKRTDMIPIFSSPIKSEVEKAAKRFSKAIVTETKNKH